MPNYDLFQNYLKNCPTDKIDCSIFQIEQILVGQLPISAYKYPAWWSNSPTHPLMKKILQIGWESRNINLKTKTISFYKNSNIKKLKKVFSKNESNTISKNKTNNHLRTGKICVITACGNKKENVSLPAWKIYKSSRIKAVYKRRSDEDMYILSAEHGLLSAEKVIKPYNRLLDEDRTKILLPKIESIIKEYEKIIYFKAGARKLYEDCLSVACKNMGVEMESFGFGFMGGINELENRINKSKEKVIT
tara:strand:- start:689 stop:1432 length:744 start_codon:yes stop_codon:yes gene_type:complete